ncbi:MAG: hypothetical protein Q9192_006972 [Flavoplaca navasiana]
MSLPSTIATINLSNPWNNADASIWHYVSKSQANLTPGPPSLNAGAIFSNGSSLWLYGGAVGATPTAKGMNSKAPPIPPADIWRYDFVSSDWTRDFFSGEPIQRLIRGQYVQASSSRAYFLGGVKDPRSDSAFFAESNPRAYAVQGLLVFDESDQKLQNVSTAGMNEAGTMYNGFLSFVPYVGGKGLLVAFGGVTLAVGADVNARLPDGLASLEPHWSMRNISVYDIEAQIWYQQQASGDVPSLRYLGCAIAVTAQDHSSHSIYVFGGWGETTIPRNDGYVYVLSLPSFTWIRVTLDIDQRSRHRCHLMGNHHMLVVGGIKPDESTSQPEGAVGCDTNPKFSQGLGIFSLNSHDWTTNYDPAAGADPYQIHSTISKVIGGNASGGATKSEPDTGFSSDALRILMSSIQQPSNTSTTNTTRQEPADTDLRRPKSSLRMSKGTIAGTALGTATGAILVVGIVTYILHRRRHLQHKVPSSTSDRSDPGPLQPLPVNEIHAAPVGQELRGGELEDNLARLYRTHEIPNTAEIHEMPALSHAQTAKVLPPDTLHTALVDDKYRKGQTSRQQAKAAKKQ